MSEHSSPWYKITGEEEYGSRIHRKGDFGPGAHLARLTIHKLRWYEMLWIKLEARWAKQKKMQ